MKRLICLLTLVLQLLIVAGVTGCRTKTDDTALSPSVEQSAEKKAGPVSDAQHRPSFLPHPPAAGTNPAAIPDAPSAGNVSRGPASQATAAQQATIAANRRAAAAAAAAKAHQRAAEDACRQAQQAEGRGASEAEKTAKALAECRDAVLSGSLSRAASAADQAIQAAEQAATQAAIARKAAEAANIACNACRSLRAAGDEGNNVSAGARTTSVEAAVEQAATAAKVAARALQLANAHARQAVRNALNARETASNGIVALNNARQAAAAASTASAEAVSRSKTAAGLADNIATAIKASENEAEPQQVRQIHARAAKELGEAGNMLRTAMKQASEAHRQASLSQLAANELQHALPDSEAAKIAEKAGRNAAVEAESAVTAVNDAARQLRAIRKELVKAAAGRGADPLIIPELPTDMQPPAPTTVTARGIDPSQIPVLPAPLKEINSTTEGVVAPMRYEPLPRPIGRWQENVKDASADFLPGGYTSSVFTFRADGILEVCRTFGSRAQVVQIWLISYGLDHEKSEIILGQNEKLRPTPDLLRAFVDGAGAMGMTNVTIELPTRISFIRCENNCIQLADKQYEAVEQYRENCQK